MDKAQLYQALVDLCQTYGITTETTYDLLHEAIESIDADPED